MKNGKYNVHSLLALYTLALASINAHGQTAPEGVKSLVPSVACDAPAVIFNVLALERGSPGELRMEVEFESLANVPQSVYLDVRRSALVDNTGYQYKVTKSPRETRLLPSGRTRAGYVFLSEVGGQQARTVSMDVRFSVRSDRSNRPCSFVVPGIPIAEVQR